MVKYYVLCNDNSTIIPLPSALPSALWTDNSKRLASKIILSLEVTEIGNKDTVEAYIYIYLRVICAKLPVNIRALPVNLLSLVLVVVQYLYSYMRIAKTCP